jgi:site-specific recombinase XerD
LLDCALELVIKYKSHPKCINDIFPVISNQKMNSYLKEIADLCGINKELTFHIARHTFATTITLSNGVPIDTVSKMLGHTNIRTTQLYAKTLEEKISSDMAILKRKLE